MNEENYLQPTLENDLVLVRPLEVGDFDAVYQAASDPEIWEQHQNPDRWEKSVFKTFFDGAMASKGAFAIIDKKSGRIIGSSRFRIANAESKAIEIGWTFLSKAFWGGTYNHSFKGLMIEHAHQHFDVVLFNVNKYNLRSQKAVGKLGGELIDKTGPLGHLHTEKKDGLTFAILK
ncbi:MAG: GNAT family N-acetyltransferase [Flavobacteriaceae bacterium]|nr:GNAT family N-acetyltransferase [Flavobacteriaceae bacterium]